MSSVQAVDHVTTPPEARVVEVIEVRFLRGSGVAPDPVRIVTAYYSKDGEILAENDPHWDGKL